MAAVPAGMGVVGLRARRGEKGGWQGRRWWCRWRLVRRHVVRGLVRGVRRLPEEGVGWKVCLMARWRYVT